MKIHVLAVIALVLFCSAFAYAQTIVVIVHKDNPLDDISLQDVRRMYSGELTTWRDGSSIQLVDWKADESSTTRFYRDIVRRSPSSTRRTWIEKVIQGNMYPPTVLATASEIVAYVVSHRGAIGYVPKEAVTNGVKAVTLDGLRADHPDYVLNRK